MSAPNATLVVPCYNEGWRLQEASLIPLTEGPDAVQLLFVDDGSRDHTAERLRGMQGRRPHHIQILSLGQNSGKAEAVRQGLLRAIAGGAQIVGYFDADLATPAPEITRLLRQMRDGNTSVLMASRVLMLGRFIHRRALRHYLGRVFASAASLVLRLEVYDTQCGAKLFRSSPALLAALREPFLSRWAFDIEILGRLVIGTEEIDPVPLEGIVEEPLLVWKDMPGSKLRAGHMLGAAVDLARIAHDLGARRRRRRNLP